MSELSSKAELRSIYELRMDQGTSCVIAKNPHVSSFSKEEQQYLDRGFLKQLYEN